MPPQTGIGLPPGAVLTAGQDRLPTPQQSPGRAYFGFRAGQFALRRPLPPQGHTIRVTTGGRFIMTCQCPQCNAFLAHGQAEQRLRDRKQLFAGFAAETAAELAAAAAHSLPAAAAA